MKFPIPDDWDGESWCKWAVCWPDSEKWRGFLRGLLTLPQRGWTWDERTGSIINVQSIGREITEANLPLVGCLMACNDVGLQTSLSEIAAAIRALAAAQCCNDLQIDVQGGIQGTITQGSGEVIPVYGSSPPLSIGPGEFPDGYPDLESYDADKCKKANGIVDGLIGSLTNIASFGTFNALTLAVLIVAAMASSIVFPPAMIPTAISVLLILSGSLFVIAQLVSLLNENRNEIVCFLYEGESVTAIIETLADFLDLLIASIPATGRVAYALKALALVIMNSGTLNQLFNSDPMVTDPDASCMGCGECENLTWDFAGGEPMGWEIVTSFPVCFPLADPALGSLTVESDKLKMTGGTQGEFKTVGAHKGGVQWVAPTGWQFDINTFCEGSTHLYLDVCFVTLDGSCVYKNMYMAYPCVDYNGASVTDASLIGKTITDIYLYCRSVPEAGALRVFFETIQLSCSA